MNRSDFASQRLGRWQATGHHLSLQPVFDLTQGFFWVQAESLQDDESDQDKCHMADQRLIHSTLTQGQAAELLGVSEESLNRPAAPLVQHNRGQIVVQVIGGEYLDIPVTVSGHDQSQGAVPGQIGHNAAGSELETGMPFQRQPLSQRRHAPAPLLVVDDRFVMQDAHPLQPQSIDLFGQPTCCVEGITDDTFDLQVIGQHLDDHLPRQFCFLPIALGMAIPFRPPEAKSYRNTLGSRTPQQHDDVKPTHLAPLTGAIGPANPRIQPTEGLGDDHVIDCQVSTSQMLGPVAVG
jgi:hypothetical protein